MFWLRPRRIQRGARTDMSQAALNSNRYQTLPLDRCAKSCIARNLSPHPILHSCILPSQHLRLETALSLSEKTKQNVWTKFADGK